MDYKVGTNFILDFIQKGQFDIELKPTKKEKNTKEQINELSNTYLSQLYKEAKESFEKEDDFIDTFNKINQLSRAFAYKIESRKSPSVGIDEISSFIINIINKYDSDLATAAMNLVTNCFFFYGKDAIISLFNIGFLDNLHNILDNDCPSDLYIETIAVLSNILSLATASINQKSIDENEELKQEQNPINYSELIPECLSFVDFDTILDALPIFPMNKLVNITNLLFRYISIQEDDILVQNYSNIIEICKSIFFRIKDIDMKDKNKRDQIKDELISSIINVLSYILIRENNLYISLIDTDIISETINLFMFPDYENVCSSMMLFLLIVMNESSIYLFIELFQEISLSQLILICEVLDFLRPISYLILAKHIKISPFEADDIQLISPFIKIPIDDAIEGEIKLKTSAFELVSTIFCNTNDFNRAFMINNGFYKCIEECIDLESPIVIKVAETILFYSNRLDIGIPDDCFEAIKECIENLTDSPIESISQEASVILSLFNE